MTRGTAYTAISAAVSTLVAASMIVPARPLLIWNATASTPVGLYAVHPASVLHTGELIVVTPPEPVAFFLAQGGFLPRGVPLLKHVAALAGQTVCRTGDAVTIDGKAAGAAFDHDHLGRPLPRWSGCRMLGKREIFVMNTVVPDSLDGRYFGPLPVTSIIGEAIPVWIEQRRDRVTPATSGGAPAISPPAERQSP